MGGEEEICHEQMDEGITTIPTGHDRNTNKMIECVIGKMFSIIIGSGNHSVRITMAIISLAKMQMPKKIVATKCLSAAATTICILSASTVNNNNNNTI